MTSPSKFANLSTVSKMQPLRVQSMLERIRPMPNSSQEEQEVHESACSNFSYLQGLRMPLLNIR